MNDEYEIIDHPQIRYLKSFLVNIEYRNPHVHNSFEICMVLKGEVQIISKRDSCTLSHNDLFIFNPAQPHELRALGKSVEILSLQFSYKLFSMYYPIIMNILFTSININPLISDDIAELLRTLLIEISYEYFSQKDFYEFKCIGLTNLMMYYIIKYVPYELLDSNKAESANNRNMRLKRIVDYIENNYTQKLLLSDIARQENLSLCYLSHFFKDNFNMNFQDYLNNLRFERARQLLLKTDMRLIDICLESGFSDTRYLNKMFIDNYSCTPKIYREKLHTSSYLPEEKSGSVQEFYSVSECLKIISQYHRGCIHII